MTPSQAGPSGSSPDPAPAAKPVVQGAGAWHGELRYSHSHRQRRGRHREEEEECGTFAALHRRYGEGVERAREEWRWARGIEGGVPIGRLVEID